MGGKIDKFENEVRRSLPYLENMVHVTFGNHFEFITGKPIQRNTYKQSRMLQTQKNTQTMNNKQTRHAMTKWENGKPLAEFIKEKRQ